MAGIESSANSRSVVPRARMTMNIGVIRRLPSTRANSWTPCHCCVAGKWVSTHLIIRFSSNSSSSEAPSLASFQAVQIRKSPNR